MWLRSAACTFMCTIFTKVKNTRMGNGLDYGAGDRTYNLSVRDVIVEGLLAYRQKHSYDFARCATLAAERIEKKHEIGMFVDEWFCVASEIFLRSHDILTGWRRGLLTHKESYLGHETIYRINLHLI